MKTKIWKGIVLVSAVAVLGVVAYAGYAIVHYMRTSPRFAVRTVSVMGLNRVEEGHVLRQAGLKGSANVFSVDLQDVRQRVEGLKCGCPLERAGRLEHVRRARPPGCSRDPENV